MLREGLRRKCVFLLQGSEGGTPESTAWLPTQQLVRSLEDVLAPGPVSQSEHSEFSASYLFFIALLIPILVSAGLHGVTGHQAKSALETSEPVFCCG
jgi:hypothetical protein